MTTIANETGSVVFVSNPRSRMQRLRKSVYNAGLEISDNLPNSWKPLFVTLTYKNLSDWQPNHIKDYLQRVRVWLRRRGHLFHYVWVAELQKRGAVHYHIILWLPPGFTLPFSDKRGWWPYGMTNQVWARKGVGYLMKYTSKGSHGFGPKFPKGIRIYGFSKHFKSAVLRVAYYRAPRWLRSKYPDFKNCHLIRKVGFWLDKMTGECYDTPLQYQFFAYSGKLNGAILVCPDLCFGYILDDVIDFYPQIKEYINEN